jgi:hypothetical protein
MRQSTHYLGHDKQKKKKKEIEGNYIPPMPGLLTKKWKCKQMVWKGENQA